MKTWKAGELREDMQVVPAHVVRTKYATIDREELKRLREDAERFRWLCASAWYVGPEPRGDTEGVSWHDHNETLNGVREAVDAAQQAEPLAASQSEEGRGNIFSGGHSMYCDDSCGEPCTRAQPARQVGGGEPFGYWIVQRDCGYFVQDLRFRSCIDVDKGAEYFPLYRSIIPTDLLDRISAYLVRKGSEGFKLHEELRALIGKDEK